MLAGGDRRSIGRANEVVDLVTLQPKKFTQLIECLWDPDSKVRMRAADAVEKISRGQAVLLQPYKAPLLGLLAETTQQEVRWHIAVMVPRMKLTRAECRSVTEALQRYLEDRSSIVRTFAMQGLSDLTRQDRSLRPMVLDLLRSLTRSGTPAMRARGRILLTQLYATA
jgi:vesicle coat complex subunit